MNFSRLALPAAFFALTTVLHADLAVFGASKDVTIFQNNVNNSNVAGPGIFSGSNGTSSIRRGLIAFDLTSIPAGSIISDVRFTLTLGQVAGSGGSASATTTVSRTFRLYDLSQSWGSNNTSTSSTDLPTGATATDIGGTGQGFPARTGDATWNARFFGVADSNWTNAGGDFSTLESASLVAAAGAKRGDAFSFTSTASPNLLTDVTTWVNNPSTNNGWLIKNDDESGGQTFFSFFTSEWSDRAAGNPAQEPALQITYTPATVPEPATCGLLITAVALLGLATRRSRKTARE